jgi:deoxyadenosine/deoxycytidine kinase
MTIILTVQGNIAAGKSTFVESLRQQYEGNSRVCFLQEPVDEWSTITDEEGKTMLALFYGNQKRYAFSFQMMAYISRLALLKRAIAKNYDIIITERSLETDRQIFAKMLYNDGKIASVEYQIYLKWFDEFKRDFPEENVIYVKTDPEISAQRVTKRGREGEIIPLEYLQKCHDYHEDWIQTIPKENLCVIDGNINTDLFPDALIAWKTQVDNFVKLRLTALHKSRENIQDLYVVGC